ncbi:bifunctional metallophosphatase/5'-nucleotidase [Sphaerochaeta globosa]|uniref:2',3'-cyclic-nucleotide 2'-phosphodiesterase n=1 Tax=Sphaerochaeta globosa (strain ATCC BAA-1886 / DSM 22777 / Buddy) TaxID=158189 RepID=F0RW42_SPHGB|nr:5'-nucleotidase C-terminal domain-containing protein [Sphaerochaeta globosa]ADY13328.1 2',3'-cyclic-nucleotide 2'-phosphodiesterase [Sphaerochaeta globosa str. Buddy]
MYKKGLKTTIVLLLLFCLSVNFLASQPTLEIPSAQNLVILGTTDLHGNVWGFSYENDKDTTNTGMARIATYVEKVRREENNVVLVDNGDTIQGNIMTDDLYNKREGEHPVMRAMNILAYDSMTLGNHEFNFGQNLISRLQMLANFPILAANMARIDGTMGAEPYTIIERSGIKIGIIGVTNPNAPRWDGEKTDPFVYAPVGPAVRKVVDIIKDKVDVIIVTSHVGIYPEYDEEGGSDGAKSILELCPEVDVLIVGHDHNAIKEIRGTTVIGGARNLGREVIRIDLALNENKEIIDRKVELVDMANYEPSDLIRKNAFIAEAHKATRDFISGGAPSADGKSSGGIFGQASVDFQPKNEILGIPEGKLRDTAVMDLINEVQLLNSGADVSAAALFADTSNIPKGDINYGTIFGIYKYDNTLYRVEVTGSELKAYMEWSAACYNQYKSGDMSISFNPEKPGYLYDMFAGVDYEIDLSKPVGQRIRNVMFKGKPLANDQRLTLAVNNYRYSSALKAQKLVAGTKEWESPNSIRDMLVEYIKAQKTIVPKVDNNWKIVGVNLASPYRDAVVKLVNEGKLEVPYAKALNVDELKKQGIIK